VDALFALHNDYAREAFRNMFDGMSWFGVFPVGVFIAGSVFSAYAHLMTLPPKKQTFTTDDTPSPSLMTQKVLLDFRGCLNFKYVAIYICWELLMKIEQ
jgi:hypothetical protein